MSKKKLRALIVVIIAVTAVVTVNIVILNIIENNESNIKKYEESLVDRYSDDGTLKNVNDRQEVLDEAETYFKNHKKKYFIRKVERDSQSVTLKFIYGGEYMIWPSVEGMK